MINPKFQTDKNGTAYSVYPPTKYLTFAPWIYMVPQYKPENVLMLGYAEGTVAGLIQLLYGDVPITGVDVVPPKENRYRVNFIQMDAEEYVKTCDHFDVVIVDMFDLEGKMCDFIMSQEFADNLTRIADYIIINTLKEPDMSAYNHLRRIGTNKPSGCSNLIHYFLVNKEISEVHPYKR